jgi:predicted HTH transcriptional regulator
LGIVCDVNLQTENGKEFLEIITRLYSVPVSLRGRYYYRSGSVKTELTGNELNEFLLKKSGKTWDDVIEEGTTHDDIDETSVQSFLEDAPEIKPLDGGVLVSLFKDYHTEDQLRKLGFSERQINAVKYVKENGKITNQQYQEINNVSRRTALRDLDELINKSIFQKLGEGKGTHYELGK